MRNKDFLKLSGKDFLKGLKDYSKDLVKEIENKVEGFPKDAGEIALRLKKSSNFEYFAKTYFPHYIKADNSVLHDYLYEKLPKINGKGARLALAAPRGEAKSTIVSLIYILWRVLMGKTHFTVIIMDVWEQATMMIAAIKAELEANPRLRIDFHKMVGRGLVWREDVIITKNNIKIQGFGSGQKIRGIKHGAYRPDTLIGDDLENDVNVTSPTQRDKLYKWFQSAVSMIGPADGSLDVIYIGTILHYDSVLNRILNNPFWNAKRFKAIIRWPDNMDLWEEWENIYKNDGDTLEEREARAEEFYKIHESVMLQGAEVSWPSVRPLKLLMKLRAVNGHEAFDTELQNDPVSSEYATFKDFTFYNELPANLVYFGAIDPSLGKKKKTGDPSAIIVVGADRSNGNFYVVEANIKRRVPDKIIEDIITTQKIYNCVAWFVESVQFQEFFRTELQKRALQSGIYLPAFPVIPNTDKILRIEGMQPLVNDGKIRFRQGQKTLIDQMRHFPKSAHDDGMDALEMAVKNATRYTTPSEIRTVNIKRTRYSWD